MIIVFVNTQPIKELLYAKTVVAEDMFDYYLFMKDIYYLLNIIVKKIKSKI